MTAPRTLAEHTAEIEAAGRREHITVMVPTEYRWEPYKPDGQRQMKAKGRWQRMELSGDFHRWVNCPRPEFGEMK